MDELGTPGDGDRFYALVQQAVSLARQQRSIRNRTSARLRKSIQGSRKKQSTDEALAELLERAMSLFPAAMAPQEKARLLSRVEATYRANFIISNALDDTAGAVDSAMQRLYGGSEDEGEEDRPGTQAQQHVEELVDMLANLDRCTKAAITIQRAYREYRAHRRGRSAHLHSVSSRYMAGIGHISVHHQHTDADHPSWDGAGSDPDSHLPMARSHSTFKRRGAPIKKEVASAGHSLEMATQFLQVEDKHIADDDHQQADPSGEPSPNRKPHHQQRPDWSKRLEELALKLEAVAPEPEPTQPEITSPEPIVNFEDLSPMDKARRALACMVKKPRRVVLPDSADDPNSVEAAAAAGLDSRLPPAPQVTPAGPSDCVSVFKDNNSPSDPGLASQPDSTDVEAPADDSQQTDAAGVQRKRKSRKAKLQPSTRSPMFTSLMLSGDLALIGTLTAAIDAAGAQGLIAAIREQVCTLQAQIPEGRTAQEQLQELPQVAKINELLRQALDVQAAAQDARNTIETACAKEVERITDEAARIQTNAAMSIKYLDKLSEKREAQEANYQQLVLEAKRGICTNGEGGAETEPQHDMTDGAEPAVNAELQGKLSSTSQGLDCAFLDVQQHHGEGRLVGRHSQQHLHSPKTHAAHKHLLPRHSYDKQPWLSSPQSSTGSAVSCKSTASSKPSWRGASGSPPLSDPCTGSHTPVQPGKGSRPMEKAMVTCATFKPSDAGWVARPAPPRTAPSILPRPQMPLQRRERRSSLNNQPRTSLEVEVQHSSSKAGTWLLHEEHKHEFGFSGSRLGDRRSCELASPQLRAGLLPELWVGPQDSKGSLGSLGGSCATPDGSGACTPTGNGRLMPTGFKAAPKWKQLDLLRGENGAYHRSSRHSSPGVLEIYQDSLGSPHSQASGLGWPDELVVNVKPGSQAGRLPKLGRSPQAEASSDRAATASHASAVRAAEDLLLGKARPSGGVCTPSHRSVLRAVPDLLVGVPSPKARHASTGGYPSPVVPEESGRARLGAKGGQLAAEQIKPRQQREEPIDAPVASWYRSDKLKAWNLKPVLPVE